MRLLVMPLALLLVLLSGCVAEDHLDEPQAPGEAAGASPEGAYIYVPWFSPPERIITVDFSGNMGTRLAVCEHQASGVCHTQDLTEHNSELIVEDKAAALLSVNLTLTWEASTMANDELLFGIMIMGENRTYLGNVSGPSPLALSLEGNAVAIRPGHVVRAFLQNELLNMRLDPVGVDGAIDDPFTIQGQLRVAEAAAGSMA